MLQHNRPRWHWIGDELNPREAGEAIERLISGTLEAQGHPMLRTDSDPNRLLLSGSPGTGKTAYGRWLAEQLSVPLVLKRASDLMSKWVGENEQNIAVAFHEARAQAALLLIDEIDSFVKDRPGAERSWELTMVNEWLIQLGSFGGLFVGTTNLIDGIDLAFLRRFDLKERFDYFRADQAVRLFDQHRELLGLHEPDPAALASVRRLDRLTPGDFAAVMRQHRCRPIASPSELAAALGREVAVKGGRTSAIGLV